MTLTLNRGINTNWLLGGMAGIVLITSLGNPIGQTLSSGVAAVQSSLGGKPNNMTRFLHIVADHESGFRFGGVSSVGAAGYFQFIGSTRQRAIAITGSDPVTPDLQRASQITAEFIQKAHPEAYAAINKGDFQAAYKLLGQRTHEWTSLPGSTEDGGKWARETAKLRAYESGEFQPKFNVNE